MEVWYTRLIKPICMTMVSITFFGLWMPNVLYVLANQLKKGGAYAPTITLLYAQCVVVQVYRVFDKCIYVLVHFYVQWHVCMHSSRPKKIAFTEKTQLDTLLKATEVLGPLWSSKTPVFADERARNSWLCLNKLAGATAAMIIILIHAMSDNAF